MLHSLVYEMTDEYMIACCDMMGRPACSLLPPQNATSATLASLIGAQSWSLGAFRAAACVKHHCRVIFRCYFAAGPFTLYRRYITPLISRRPAMAAALACYFFPRSHCTTIHVFFIHHVHLSVIHVHSSMHHVHHSCSSPFIHHVPPFRFCSCTR